MEEARTLVINNFSGQLTRNNFGDINSGLAKFDTSFGYNPFFKPGQLTWFKDLANESSIFNSGVPLASTSRVESGVAVTYVITSTGHLFRVIGDGSGGADLHTLATGSPTFTYGADMAFFGVGNTLYISHDLGVTKIVINSAGGYVSEAQVGTWDATHFTPIITRRCLKEFLGNLYVANSDASVTYSNNLAQVDSSGTVLSYAILSPSLPAGSYIRDLDISQDLTYLLISSSLIPSELIAPVNDGVNTGATNSTLYQWNGTDLGVTTGTTLPTFGVTALQTFLNSRMMFMYDSFGSALFDGNQKVLTMRNNKSPMPPATGANGNFVTWACPDLYWNLDTDAGQLYGSLYYFGSLDATTPPGLFRLFRKGSTNGGQIYSIPWQAVTTNRFVSMVGGSLTTDSNGVHLVSFIDYNGVSPTYLTYLFMSAPPDNSPGGWTGAIAGVYETQTQAIQSKDCAKTSASVLRTNKSKQWILS
jgi:hypothetical protein